MAAAVATGGTDPQAAVFEAATEYFGFTPVSFVDDVVNAVNHYVFQAVESLQAFLTARKTPTTATVEEIERGLQRTRQGTDQIVTLLESNLDRNFDRFELYVLRNIFWVPLDAPLPHRQGLDFGKSAEDERAVDAQIDMLRARLRAAQVVESALQQERQFIESRLQRLTQSEQQLQFVGRLLRDHQLSPNANEALAHVTEAVVALKGLVQDSVRLLQTDYYRAGILALARGPEDAAPSSSALASIATLDDLRAFQAAASTTPQ